MHETPKGFEPAHPRWFSLDDPQTLEQLRESPRLLAWVVNRGNLNSLVERAKFPCGIPTQISRGNLQWQFSLPDDGRLLAGGVLPYIVQWQTDTHPAHPMKDVGIRLKSFTLYHPDSGWLKDMLRSIGAERLVDIHDTSVACGPGLEAVISTARGDFTLNSVRNQSYPK